MDYWYLARIPWENMQYWNWHCVHDLAWLDRIEVNWDFTSLHFRYIIQRPKKTKGEQMITLFVPSQGISCPKNHEFCKLVMLFVYYDVLTRACANNLLTWMFYHIDCKGLRLLSNDELQFASWYQWTVLLYRTLCKIFLILGLSPS